MTRTVLLLTLACLLAACGADGMPDTPGTTTPAGPSATLSGLLSTGIARNGTNY